jgi:hypothetical protein
MDRRLTYMSLILISLLPSVAFAQQPEPEVQQFQASRTLFSDRIDLSLRAPYAAPPDDFLSSVTMRSLPQGSLYIRYDGLHSVVMRQARSQARRFTRQALREGWYVNDETVEPRAALLRKIDNAADPQIDAAWWTRRWLDSLPVEKGGSPSRPYVHTYGSEITWHLGPFRATNTLKCRFDYLAFFEVDSDPVDPDHPDSLPPVAIDVLPIEETGPFGSTFRVDVKPRIQIGMPTDVDGSGVVRGVSIQVSFEFWNLRQKLVKGDVSVRWRPDDGLAASFEVALVSW